MYGTVLDPLYIKNRDLKTSSGERVETYDICKSLSNIVGTRNVDGVQLVRGLWKVYVKTLASRMELLSKGISVNGISVTMFDTNPFVREFDNQEQVEKITIKDLPLSLDNDKIKEFLNSHEGLVLKSGIRYGKVRDENGSWSDFKNGDRFVYALAPIIPTIKRDSRIDDHPCRIFHSSQESICKSCKETGHKTGSIECPAFDDSGSVLAFKSYENVLSNFYQCEITWSDNTFQSVEHAYQWTKAMELEKHDLAQKIKDAKHAGAAKAISRKGISKDESELWEGRSEEVMKDLLRAKLESCTQFRDALIQSGDKILAEATGSTLWATGLDVRTTSVTKAEYWPGMNMLGLMLMDIRDSLMKDDIYPSPHKTDVDADISESEEEEILHSPSPATSQTDKSQTQNEESEGKMPTSFLQKINSIFKGPQTNIVNKQFTKHNKNKRRQSTTPPKPKEKKVKTSGSLSDEAPLSDYTERKLLVEPTKSSENTSENTNHKPDN